MGREGAGFFGEARVIKTPVVEWSRMILAGRIETTE